MAVVPTSLADGPAERREWLTIACTLLVLGCPCALVLATPATVVSGLAAAANSGVLIKGGQYLEALGLLGAVGLDKTGTLTENRMTVVAGWMNDKMYEQDDGSKFDLDRSSPPERQRQHFLSPA